MFSRLSCLAALALAGLSVAQDLGVPLSWRKFSNNRTQAEIIGISQGAIAYMFPQLNSAKAEFNGIGYWQSGNVWASMANHDYRAGSSAYASQVIPGLNTAFSLYVNYDQWGPNSVRARSQSLFVLVVVPVRVRSPSLFALVASELLLTNLLSVITQDVANAGRIATKKSSFRGTCEGKTMAGGVFWRANDDDLGINSITTGLYLTLSAYLAEATGDSKYTNAAILSANWIKTLNMRDDYIALDGIGAGDCGRSSAGWLFTYNTGKFVEGLNVLADVTGDGQWKSLATYAANAAMKTGAWQGSNGIITEGASPSSNNDGVGFKSILIRGLDEAYMRRQHDNEALRILIHSYVCVQLNALLDLAATGYTYSSAWAGPPQAFTTWGQMAALDVFVAAIHAA
uniref:Glycoside hydrolase family 76 protein n=1 Tax=Schizophyllum commune (strain H4-8 / FGSC 9210) TaxID=578458 RepID=D8QI18_SCHCM